MILGLFDLIFGRSPKPKGDSEEIFRVLNGYTPHFTSFGGGIYESELIRAAINARATHISKLDVTIQGTAKPKLQSRLKYGPNKFQTWPQFLYRLSTILDVHNSAFIVPGFDEYGEVDGIYCVLPERCSFVEYGGVPYVRYEFSWGERAAVELSMCGIMTKFQYKDDILGETNAALRPTLELINIQNQGIEEGVKSAATYRFMAQLSNFSKVEDIAKERQRFTAENFGKDSKGKGGILLFPNTYNNLKQIEVKPWIVDADQMKVINQGVYNYFGVNEDILTNKAYGNAWAAFYEGVVESFAVQFSEILTAMLFTQRERAQGSLVAATSNRLQYMSNADKLNVSAQMADRGLMTRNEIRQIWNLPPLPEPIGSSLPVRGEYYNIGDEEEDGDEQDDDGQAERG